MAERGIAGTASTGAAIGTLSGAAATNATLAWLGGGALSAGGLGVTGGVVVLGGIAVVPAALVAMYFGQNRAKQKLNAARDFSDSVDVVEAQINTLVAQLPLRDQPGGEKCARNSVIVSRADSRAVCTSMMRTA